MSATRDELKDAYARWATGVTIVTARVGDRVHGMTVSSFTEVSLAPPLVLVCADKTSNTHPLIAEGRVKPVIHATFDLKDAARAHELMETSTHIGKIVLKI